MIFDTNQVGTAAALALDKDRDGFPEPTLLPHLAHTLAASEFPMLLGTVDEAGNGRSGLPPWPRLISATCLTVAKRLEEMPEEDVVATLTLGTNELYSHLDTHALDAALQILGADAESWNATARAERLARVAASHPGYSGGIFVDLASAALYDLSPQAALSTSAWFLPLTGGEERRQIIDSWRRSDWPDLNALTALFVSANDAEKALLTPPFLEFLSTRMPVWVAPALATVWPHLSADSRTQSQVLFASAVGDAAASGPTWWFSLLWSRTVAIGASVDLDLGDIDPVWRDWLGQFGALPQQSAFDDVLRAHPGASLWMASDTYPGFPAESAQTVLETIQSRWGAHQASMAADEAPSVTVSAPAPESIPIPSAASRPSHSLDRPPRWWQRRFRYGGGGGGGGMDASAPPPGLGGVLGGLLGGSREIFGRVFGNGPRVAAGTEDIMRGPGHAPQPDRRLQADVALADNNGKRTSQLLTGAFVAGAKHVVDISVGRGASLQVAVGFVEPDFVGDVEFETLQVRLLNNDTVIGGEIDLPKDTALDSNTWPAILSVPADAVNIEATVVVLHKSRVLQVAKLSGQVVSSLNAATTADGEIEFTVVADVHELTRLETRGAFDASFLSDGKSGAAFAGDDYRVQDLRGIEKTINKMTEKLFKSTESVVMAGGDGDPEKHQALLVYLAVHGKALHSKLIKPRLSALNSAKRIQVVNAGESPILPLEFVYSGPSPTHNAALCGGWRDALRDGECPTCTPQPDGVRVDTVCPLNFWALSKVIERHAPGKPRVDGYDYSLSTCVPGERDQLNPLEHALFAASDNVPEKLIEATLEDLRSIDATCEEALTWTDWTKGVINKSPTLLVSMPHNALDPVIDIPTLEIGRGSDLRAGEVTRSHVCTADVETGPVVLLLGCQTAQGGPLPYHTFVTEFRDNGAAIVIGTLATVLGEHAAPIVRVILGELAKTPNANENTFGDLVLRMRRQMFADGILIALAVAAFGDADWMLADTGD